MPVPNILDWNDDESNPIGCKYIFMDHVPSVQLSSCWDKMSSTENLCLIKFISDMIGQMAALEFPAYGSIYFQDAPIDPALKTRFEDGFCIGPSCNPVLWKCRPGEAEVYWNSGQSHGSCKLTTERDRYRRKLTHLPRAEHARVLHRTISICSFSHAS